MPYLIVVTGRPGAGKTTFSKELSKHLYLPVISRDEIKEGYVHTFEKRHSELSSDTNKVVFDIFIDTVTSLLSANVSIIVEAAFQHRIVVELLLREYHNATLSHCIKPRRAAIHP